jgi:hypothetical protein
MRAEEAVERLGRVDDGSFSLNGCSNIGTLVFSSNALMRRQ